MKLKAPKDKVIVSVDREKKNWHQFADGTKLRLERKYNNLNRRETEPVNAVVIDSEYIPEGSEILIHHNALHDTYLINDYQKLSGKETASDIKYYSVDENRCYLWREPKGEWKPLKGFCTALRVYEPYRGFLLGIEPSLVPNVLLVTSGELEGKVVYVLKASDYEIIYQNEETNREDRVIRLRHYEGDEINEREEIVALDEELTRRVHAGELLVGLTPTKAELYQEYALYG